MADFVAEPRASELADQGHMRMVTGAIVEADRDPELRSIVVREMLRLQSTLAERKVAP